MNYGKAVEEVWTWREKFEKELSKVPHDQQVKYINETARETCRKLGIKCRRAAPREKAYAEPHAAHGGKGEPRTLCFRTTN